MTVGLFHGARALYSFIDYASLHGESRRVFQVAVLGFSMRCFVQGYI